MADTEDSRAKRRAYKRAWQRAWRTANREKDNAYHREWERKQSDSARQEANARKRGWHAANREKTKTTSRRWVTENPARAAYLVQKSGAKRRNIAFLLTLDEWLTIWLDSGNWERRGPRKGQFVMARFGDIGPYAVGNVRICTNRENNAETKRGRQFMSDKTRNRISDAAKARDAKNPEAAKARVAHARAARHRRPPLRT
jgi:hypothetical protein